MSDETKSNPWGLTPKQAEVMDAMVETGCYKAAARKLNRSLQTITSHMTEASNCMGFTGHDVRKFIAWDRFRRSQQQSTTPEKKEA